MAASYSVLDSELETLRGKTILIIGAATGIGKATVVLAHREATYWEFPVVQSANAQ
jgi:NADPH:quinone reductase-like Zn-dependent oxidoreductase